MCWPFDCGLLALDGDWAGGCVSACLIVDRSHWKRLLHSRQGGGGCCSNRPSRLDAGSSKQQQPRKTKAAKAGQSAAKQLRFDFDWGFQNATRGSPSLLVVDASGLAASSTPCTALLSHRPLGDLYDPSPALLNPTDNQPHSLTYVKPTPLTPRHRPQPKPSQHRRNERGRWEAQGAIGPRAAGVAPQGPQGRTAGAAVPHDGDGRLREAAVRMM